MAGVEGELGFTPLPRKPGERPLYAPTDAMRQVQQKLIVMMRDNFDYPTPYKSFVHNATKLMGNHSARFLYVVDLSGAFQAVDMDRLAGMLNHRSGPGGRKVWFDTDDEARKLLARLVQAPGGGLIQGAPLSPYLFELYVGMLLDQDLVRYADELDYRTVRFTRQTQRRRTRTLTVKYGLHYSRFVDDLVVSSDYMPIGWRKREAICRVVARAGFRINTKKTRHYDLERAPVRVNGVTVSRRNKRIRLNMPRDARRHLHGLIWTATNDGLDEVSCDEIHGLFGYFLAATPRRPFNNAEQRLVDDYNILRGLLGLEPRDYSRQLPSRHL